MKFNGVFTHLEIYTKGGVHDLENYNNTFFSKNVWFVVLHSGSEIMYKHLIPIF